MQCCSLERSWGERLARTPFWSIHLEQTASGKKPPHTFQAREANPSLLQKAVETGLLLPLQQSPSPKLGAYPDSQCYPLPFYGLFKQLPASTHSLDLLPLEQPVLPTPNTACFPVARITTSDEVGSFLDPWLSESVVQICSPVQGFHLPAECVQSVWFEPWPE